MRALKRSPRRVRINPIILPKIDRNVFMFEILVITESFFEVGYKSEQEGQNILYANKYGVEYEFQDVNEYAHCYRLSVFSI